MEIGSKLTRPVVIHGIFEPEKGKQMPHYGFLISDVASLYEPIHPRMRHEFDSSWWRRDPDLRTEWMPYDLGSTEEARDAVRRFVFPEKLIHQANALSRRLVSCLSEDARPRIQRRQAAGRFDPMAAGRMLTAVRGGSYDPATVRPFTATTRESPQRPHVGIVAAGNWSAMWRDKDYIPNVAVLTMAVAWACEALGCLCTSVLARNVLTHCNNKNQLGLVYISKPGESIPLKAYSTVMHREMYRVGGCMTDFAHEQHVRLKKVGAAENYLIGQGELHEAADEEFNGIAWAKQQGCSITISIGEFDDSDEADVKLESGTKLEDAIEQISVQLERQKRAA